MGSSTGSYNFTGKPNSHLIPGHAQEAGPVPDRAHEPDPRRRARAAARAGLPVPHLQRAGAGLGLVDLLFLYKYEISGN